LGKRILGGHFGKGTGRGLAHFDKGMRRGLAHFDKGTRRGIQEEKLFWLTFEKILKKVA
jgi:hypothetical protein